MNKHTKKIAIIAGVLFLVTIAAAALSVRVITVQSAKLSEQITAIEIDRAQQTIFTQISRTDGRTQDTRNELQNFFVESQSDSIDFLNYIEAQATDVGVALETLNPKEIERDGVTYLSVSYDLKGSLTTLEAFISQLENIPYVSQIESLKFDQQSNIGWTASVVITVHVLNYEN
jgi:hypothetical protein